MSDPVEIANHFCDYFNNIGYNLAKKIPDANISHRTHLSGTYSGSISLSSTTQLEVSDISDTTLQLNTVQLNTSSKITPKKRVSLVCSIR
jgi:hypothetical protein